MIHKMKISMIKLVSAVLLLVPATALSSALSLPFMTATASAATAPAPGTKTITGDSTPAEQQQINKCLKSGSNIDLTCTKTDTSGGTNLADILTKVINILSVLVGAIAVIMIIVGGFRYVTSAGSDSSTAAARKTIMYALVGLVIVALAQIIVHFVLNNIAG